MRRVSFALACLALLALVGAAGATKRASPFAGQWQTSRGPMTLRAYSEVVDWGEFGADGSGRLCGVHVFGGDSGPQTISLSGIWYQGGPVDQPTSSIECPLHQSTPWGRFFFTLSADGTSFTGGFTTNGDGLPIGNTSSWPPWTGSRTGAVPPQPQPSPQPQPQPGGERFDVSVSGTGAFIPADRSKNVFRFGSGTYRLTKPKITLAAAVRHDVTVVEAPVKVLSGTARVDVVLRRISGTGRSAVPYRFLYKVVKADDQDVTAKGQAFAFTGKLTSPKLSICKTLDVYSDPAGALFDFTICGVEGDGQATTSIEGP